MTIIGVGIKLVGHKNESKQQDNHGGKIPATKLS